MDDAIRQVQNYLTTAHRAWEITELPTPPSIPPRCVPGIARPAAPFGSPGPAENQWSSSFHPGDTWEQIFPDNELDANGRIRTHPAPPVYARGDEPARKQATTAVLTWMVAKDLNTTDTEAAVKAVKILDLAGKHEQRTLGFNTITDVRSFMRRYGYVILPGRNPPEISVPMPAVAPKDIMAPVSPTNQPPEGRPITDEEMTTGNPAIATQVAGMRWKDPLRKILQEDLIKCYVAHSFMVEQHNKWITDESNIETWYKEANDTQKKEDDRTIEANDLKPYCKCTWPFCKWTICGKGAKTFMEIPSGGPTPEFKAFWRMEADVPNGRFFATEDYRDDGRGNSGRLARYRKAYENHYKHEHSLTNKSAIKEDPPEFKMKMTPEEFEEQKEQWRRYNQVHPAHTEEIRFDMLRRSMTVELYKVLKSEMDLLRNRIDTEEQVEKMMETIKQNAVCYTPNETYLKAFESIRQENGEKVDPYLSRLKSAAVKVDIKKRGTCSIETCKDITCPVKPCDPAKAWYKFIKENAEKGIMYICDDTDSEIKNSAGVMVPGRCPPCCREVDDQERRDWMLKKQFLANMLNARNRSQIYLRLQTTFHQQIAKGRFDALKFEMPFIMSVARQVEEVFERDRPETHRDTNQGGAGNVKQPQRQRGGQNKSSQKSQNSSNKPKLAGGMINGKCCGCGEAPHGPKVEGKPTNGRAHREKHCKGWGKTCRKCQKEGHLEKVCEGGKPTTRKQQGGGTYTKSPSQTPPVEPNTTKKEETGPVVGGAGRIIPPQQRKSGIETTEELNNGWDTSVSSYGAGGATVTFGDEKEEPLIWANEPVPEQASNSAGNGLRGEH